MGNRFSRALAAVALIASGTMAASVGTPAAAQNFSDGYNFLKAVKERDGNKATELISGPNTTIINSRDRGSGEGALHMLVRDRDFTWLSYLLGKRARADIQNNKGETPLSIAAQLGWVEGAQLLLRQGATVDLANSSGETPLILAVRNRDMAMVRLLLGKGASPTKTDRVAGYSALDYARQDVRAAPIVKLLEAPQTPARPVAGPGR